MLGHFKIPVNVSFILHIEMHNFGTEADDRQLNEILQRWEFCSCPRMFLQQSREGEAKYINWIKTKLLLECQPIQVGKRPQSKNSLDIEDMSRLVKRMRKFKDL